jgi:hypothetical protein
VSIVAEAGILGRKKQKQIPLRCGMTNKSTEADSSLRSE